MCPQTTSQLLWKSVFLTYISPQLTTMFTISIKIFRSFIFIIPRNILNLVVYLQQHDIIEKIRWVILWMDVVKLHLHMVHGWLFQVMSTRYNCQLHPAVWKNKKQHIICQYLTDMRRFTLRYVFVHSSAKVCITWLFIVIYRHLEQESIIIEEAFY